MCLFGEARGEGPEGVRGVANVIRNRVLHPRNRSGKRYGRGIRGVILRPGAFDCMRPTDPNLQKLLDPLRFEGPEIWRMCHTIALATIAQAITDSTMGATHYYDDSLSVPPWWARVKVIEAGRMTPTVRIGRLLFLRES
jgi:spore germination cell wall hydrolase CwlJ-like protein